ncbi:MAG: GNAT family N-acetyltransferase [Proteobacteria bacterium]|nr:GNAT family N-acetyltransferase [Pseudomonadota bacterium]
MTLRGPPVIEPLGDHHDRDSFSCGEPSLDAYIRRQAGQDVRRQICKVFVATLDDPASIAGFYTLSAAAVESRNLPLDLARRLPKHPLPAALIGRLAVDAREQGQGIGKYMLMDALTRAVAASALIGIYAVIVDAIDDNAKAFYRKYGFQPFPDTPTRLFIPLETAFPRKSG